MAEATARQLALQYDDLRDVVPSAGALDLLATLRLPWAVVTSADAPLAAARLGAAGITPPLLVTVDDVSAGKPDPEGYLLAATRLGVDPARCLVVEDCEPGLAAGRAAGASTAALKGLPGDVRLADLSALRRLLGPWRRLRTSTSRSAAGPPARLTSAAAAPCTPSSLRRARPR